jgi:ribulose kinase
VSDAPALGCAILAAVAAGLLPDISIVDTIIQISQGYCLILNHMLLMCGCRVSDAPALGCAILAAVAAGLHADISSAVKAMVHVSRVVQPNPERHAEYAR